jgi:uncharacterized protein (DUF433 family)
VPRDIIGPYLHRVRYAHGEAAAWSPVDHVVLDPRVQFGEPVVDGTRVLTAIVAEVAERSDVEAAAGRLDIPVAAARSAVQFERRLGALQN